MWPFNLRGFDPRIWLLAIGTFATGTDAFVIAGILQEFGRYFGVSDTAAGWAISSYAFVYAIGTPILAVIVARWRQDRVAIAALSLFVIINILCAVAPSFTFLIVMRVAAALCAAVYAPAAYVLADSAAPPDKRGTARAAVAFGSSGSAVFSVPLGTYIGHAFSWQATFVMIAVISAIAVFALAARGPRADAVGVLLPLAQRVAPLARRAVWIVLAPVLLMFCAIYALYSYIEPLLKQGGYDAAGITWLLAAYGVGSLIGSQLGGKLADRFGPYPPLIAALSAFTVLNALFDLALPSVTAIALVMFGLPLCSWLCFAPNQSRIIDAEPEHRNVVLALLNSAIFFGGSVGTAFAGAVQPTLPVTGLPYLAAILSAIAVALTVPFARRHH